MFTGADKNNATASSSSTTQPYSSYRFNAMRWDSTSGSYDMGFRNYDPGINQFASRDMYDGATQNMGLTTDPFTGSLYAFGNGNPVSNTELDGHMACADGTSDCSVQGGAQWAPKPPPASTSCLGPVLSCGSSPSYTNVPASSGSGSSGGTSPTPINNPGWADPAKTRLPPIAYAGIAATNWFSATKTLSDYFTAHGQIANGDFTLILSEVQVETSEGSIPRVIAFANANGLPKSLRNQLTQAGVKIFKADPVEDHAEIAAANFRASPEQQEAYLGGQISKVNSAVMNNLPCSIKCANNFTEYIGNEDVTIGTTDRGITADGNVITSSVAARMRAAGDGEMYAGLVDPAIFDNPEGYQPP
jgi:RHS repeat-associated protein